jgi:hypothetical protein
MQKTEPQDGQILLTGEISRSYMAQFSGRVNIGMARTP